MNIPIWPGSSSFTTGSTSYGYYDSDAAFQQDADRVAIWSARKLGYPVVDVELQAEQFYDAFEEAITEFGIIVNMYNARDYISTLQGSSTSTNLNQRVITPNLGRVIAISKAYGAEAGSGGDVDWKRGYIELTPGTASYDLNALWADPHEASGSIEIKRVFHQPSPAISRYFDPQVGTGGATQQMLDGFGWGSYSPAVSFLVMPMYADLLRMQAIELNDMIRKSGFSFTLRNNKLQLSPIPTDSLKLWFEYVLTDDRNNTLRTPTGSISDLSNVPYSRITYQDINDIGKRWIRLYTLAAAKETLGNIRGKYTTVPVPGAEVTLNGADLIAQAREDKTNLKTELTELLQTMTRQGQMEQESAIATAVAGQLKYVPLGIYIA